jgi:hypothetical protein
MEDPLYFLFFQILIFLKRNIPIEYYSCINGT